MNGLIDFLNCTDRDVRIAGKVKSIQIENFMCLWSCVTGSQRMHFVWWGTKRSGDGSHGFTVASCPSMCRRTIREEPSYV